MYAASKTEYIVSHDVLQLGDDTMDQAVEEFDYIYCLFIGPQYGCSHQADHIYMLAEDVEARPPEVKLALISCFSEKKTCAKYGIPDGNYIKNLFITKGNAINIKASLDHPGLYDWMRRQIQPTSIHIATAEQAQEVMNRNEITALFLGATDSEAYSAFLTASKSIYFVQFYDTNEQSLRDMYSVQDEGIILSRSKDDEIVVYTGDLSESNIIDFITANMNPLVTHFMYGPPRNWIEGLGQSLDRIFLVLNSTVDNKDVTDVFRTVAKEFKSRLDFRLFSMNQTDDLDWAEQIFYVTADNIPGISIEKYDRNDLKPIVYQEDEVTVDKLKKFIQDYLDGVLTPVSVPGYYSSYSSSYKNDIKHSEDL